MSIIKVDYGEVGGGIPITYQVTLSRNLYAIIVGPENVVDAKQFGVATNYSDDYIEVTRSANSNSITVKVLKDCSIEKVNYVGNAEPTKTVTNYVAGTTITYAFYETVELINIVF